MDDIKRLTWVLDKRTNDTLEMNKHINGTDIQQNILKDITRLQYAYEIISLSKCYSSTEKLTKKTGDMTGGKLNGLVSIGLHSCHWKQ